MRCYHALGDSQAQVDALCGIHVSPLPERIKYIGQVLGKYSRPCILDRNA
jgi:hypothetical protein